MKMINYNQAKATLQKQIKTHHAFTLTFTTYKRDRKIHIKKQGNDYQLIEEGYIHETFDTLSEKEMMSLFKKKMKVEFPRSHKLYMGLTLH